jgi:predicted unusual protein kinase regulating ubiquinone biosynthesis (AarF/ABC1/UbiB family)
VFKNVDPEPLASASLAQAHAAWLGDGTPVILKIQRPGIDEQVTRDLDMIRRLTRRLEAQAARQSRKAAPTHAFPRLLLDPRPAKTRRPRLPEG